MVPKVGKLVFCCEDSCSCDRGGLGSDFGWIVWEFVVGYAICNGGRR
jgi:hypothetical protein